jgi:hypothetical protein
VRREFAVCQQSRIGRDHGAAKLEYQAVVEIELENPVVWIHPPRSPSPHRSIHDKVLMPVSESA